MAEATPRTPLAADLADRVTEFARSYKAAARTFSMYPDGQELPRKREANLWETAGTERDVSILSPLDPADYGIDPLEIVDLG
ncbi:MAG: hypothetical protein QGF21_07705 [Vicinamibacterales bacterium]|jgi:hypothetical protein|nr:hypothetical protein [Acidobacteriota bacterium]MDP7471171.1 hypothetical protein [Vicinamibacterales bacterium]MDP7671812.1 hypothetical protein [Vicinamibacterales bacterium]HJO38672.1 hypothetical protein [Vicinamibacterales bacterium]|tara:strand:+ start:195 stop:440 length:246 start_codon:yes stop_codon:yes gene_type:complete